MEIYVARDSSGLCFFKDRPDLVRFNMIDPVEWTGYPVDFGDLSTIKNLLSKDPNIIELEEYAEPIHIKIKGLKITVIE